MERPILFSGPMVQAILAGRKTQTRRIVKPQPLWVANPHVPFKTNDCDPKGIIKCPYGLIGDRLWVRESFAHASVRPGSSDKPFVYRADLHQGEYYAGVAKWKPSIHMPREASRMLLEITDIRVERLQDISQADAQAEGCCYGKGGGVPDLAVSPEDHFPTLWESINGADSWAANPWVWVVEFKVIQGGAL